jgi:hypothetical protein
MLRTMALVMAVTAVAASAADACGDKFLVIGRGVRAQRAKGGVHHASILMYVDPRRELGAALDETKLALDLKLAGHRIQSVHDERGLEAALARGGYDIVLAGMSDLGALAPRLGAGPSAPVLLPLLYDPTPEELSAAEHRYRCVMRSPGKKQHFLAVIDDAMILRARERSAVSKKP